MLELDPLSTASLAALATGILLGWLLRGRRSRDSVAHKEVFHPAQKQHPSYCPTCGNRLPNRDTYGNECERCGARFSVRWSS